MPELKTPETVCPAHSSAVSWFHRPGQGVRYDRAQISARGISSGTHARRPPGGKCPVFMPIVTAARGYVFSMSAFKFTAREISGDRLSVDQCPRKDVRTAQE